MAIISPTAGADPSTRPQLQQLERKSRNLLQIIKILYSSLLLVKAAQRGCVEIKKERADGVDSIMNAMFTNSCCCWRAALLSDGGGASADTAT